MFWDREILSAPEAEYIEPCNDYYLRSDASLIQLLRSPLKDRTIGPGRIALATNARGAGDSNPATAKAMTTWYRQLQKWIMANFANSFVYASEHVPKVGREEKTVWVGPDALARHNAGWKLKHNGPVEYSLRYFAPDEKAEFLAKFRSPKRFVATGTVQRIEATPGHSWRHDVSLNLDNAIGLELPLASHSGVVSTSHPLPKVGDEVACTFQENVMGRISAPWEAR